MADTWSDAEDRYIREQVAEGASAGQIAQAMKGRSRNAILGRIHRLRKADGAADRPTIVASRRPGSVGSRKSAKLPGSSSTRTPHLPSKPSASRRERVPALPPVPMICEGVTFLDAVDRERCLHFIGNPYSPDGPDMPVCGAERAGVLKTRYCAYHLYSQTDHAALAAQRERRRAA